MFSVCIPTYNRARSLRRALKSAVSQNVENYEIIVSDNDSRDETKKVTESFGASKIKYWKNPSNIGMVGNWNQVLKLAKGEYVAFLFDDDEFATSHLREASKVLKAHPSVGIYAVGNQFHKLPRTGLLKARDYFAYAYHMKWVSTPSETIVKRTHGGKRYEINERYQYCPEVELYLEIAGDGFDAYLSHLQTVLRKGDETANNRQKALTWIPFGDKFKIIKKYRRHPYIDEKQFTKAFRFNLANAFKTYVEAKLQKKGEPEKIFKGIRNVAKKEFPLTYGALCLGKGITDIVSMLNIIDSSRAKKLYHLIKYS